MPVRHVASLPKVRLNPELRDQLEAEWRQPSDGSADRPLIFEEGGGEGRAMRLYVIWDQWRDVDRGERSEVIMDAYERVHGLDAARRVTVAMGLTPAEARRLGIRFE